MVVNIKKKLLLLIVVCLYAPLSAFADGLFDHKKIYPTDQTLYDLYPFTLSYYQGATFNTPLVKILRFTGFKRWPEDINSLEFAYTFDRDNGLRRFLDPIVGIVQIAGNISIRHGDHEPAVYEFDPHLQFRWANMPWNQYVTTSFAIGEGVSLASKIPAVEVRNRHHNEHSKQFLNYLMLEATFSPPSYPLLQAFIRIHHRSGAFGLYGAQNSGSNNIGIGIRYLFD